MEFETTNTDTRGGGGGGGNFNFIPVNRVPSIHPADGVTRREVVRRLVLLYRQPCYALSKFARKTVDNLGETFSYRYASTTISKSPAQFSLRIRPLVRRINKNRLVREIAKFMTIFVLTISSPPPLSLVYVRWIRAKNRAENSIFGPEGVKIFVPFVRSCLLAEVSIPSDKYKNPVIEYDAMENQTVRKITENS